MLRNEKIMTEALAWIFLSSYKARLKNISHEKMLPLAQRNILQAHHKKSMRNNIPNSMYHKYSRKTKYVYMSFHVYMNFQIINSRVSQSHFTAEFFKKM